MNNQVARVNWAMDQSGTTGPDGAKQNIREPPRRPRSVAEIAAGADTSAPCDAMLQLAAQARKALGARDFRLDSFS